MIIREEKELDQRLQAPLQTLVGQVLLRVLVVLQDVFRFLSPRLNLSGPDPSTAGTSSYGDTVRTETLNGRVTSVGHSY